MRKITSSNTINKQKLETVCGMAYTASVLGGRWKISILGYLLDNGRMRYSQLKKTIPNISERMLIAQLKELESDGLVNRISYPEVPPRVEYELTEKGQSLKIILIKMSEWGEKYRAVLEEVL